MDPQRKFDFELMRGARRRWRLAGNVMAQFQSSPATWHQTFLHHHGNSPSRLYLTSPGSFECERCHCASDKELSKVQIKWRSTEFDNVGPVTEMNQQQSLSGSWSRWRRPVTGSCGPPRSRAWNASTLIQAIIDHSKNFSTTNADGVTAVNLIFAPRS